MAKRLGKKKKKRLDGKKEFNSSKQKSYRPAKSIPKPKEEDTNKETPESDDKPEGVRFNKFVANSGLCSRRKAAEMIKEGLIKVNKKVIKEPGYLVQLTDRVTYQGKTLRPEKKQVYLLMNKPKNVITTTNDERGRRTVMDVIGDRVKERIFPVGRLDRATTGLLLFTNDGDLAKKLSHPSHKVKKIYHVILDKPVTKEDLKQIRTGLELEDGKVEVDAVDYVANAPKTEVGIEIHVGKNRIVRRIFEHLGYQVEKLDRTYYGGLTKKDLPRGWWRHLEKREVIMLKHFV